MAGSEQLALQTAEQEQKDIALAQADAWVLMIERLATNPDVNVEKLERLLAMQERVLARGAEAEFNTAFAAMQADIPVIVEKHDGDGGKWTFAPLEDIVEPLRPVLTKHGFSISHQTEWPERGTVKVIGILTHRSGHARRSEFQANADTSGSKNAIQALGSTRSYGQRYTTIALLNIATRGTDDDGASSEKFKHADPPAGYDKWLLDMEACADEGWPKLSKAFSDSKPEFRNHATRVDKQAWEALKVKAQKVQR